MSVDFERLPKQLRYWSIHCGVNALPSFLVVVIMLSQIQEDIVMLSVGAMLCAIVIFVITYTLITSIKGLFDNPKSLLSRALRIGAKTRLVISVVSLPFLVGLVDSHSQEIIMFCPDYWAGVGAVLVYAIATGETSSSPPVDESGVGFMDIFAVTMIEGVILSIFLFTVAFIALVILQIRARRRGDFFPSSVDAHAEISMD